jgi:hypothetical protein
MNYVQLSAGMFDKANGSNAETMTKIFSNIAAAKPERLVVYFHGGLVSRPAALASADRLSPLYASAGAESLFVVWETSVPEILNQNVRRIVDEPIFQSILVRATEFVKGKLEKSVGPGGGRFAGGLPRTLASEIESELDRGRQGAEMFEDLTREELPAAEAPTQDGALTDEEKQYIENQVNNDADLRMHVRNIIVRASEPGSKSVEAAVGESTLMDPEVLSEIAPGPSAAPDEASRSVIGTIMLGKRVVTVVGAVIWRYANNRDHGLYLTLMEEIMRAFYVRAAGRFLWQEMKAAVDSAFIPDADHVGQALVNEFARLWKDHKPRIILVGHSAGSIYIARLLKELNKAMQSDFKADIVLIAPACTFDVLAESLESAGNRVASLRIFGMSDVVERNDHLVPAIYPASLLYFVSGVLEDNRDEPIVGMQRFYSERYVGPKYHTIADLKSFSPLLRKHSYAWAKASGFDGANCDMITHGGWADGPETLASVLYLIKEGWSNA